MFDFVSVAFADQAATAATAASQPSILESLIPFLFIFVVMYFLMIRPQAKKAKEHASLLGALKVGDEVVTSSGIIGRVKTIADDFVALDVGAGSIKILKDHIQRYTKEEKAKTPTPATK